MGAVDSFLKLEGIEGESKDDKHKAEIDIDSWSWGASQSGTFGSGGGGGAGKVSVKDITFTTKVSKASPKLMEACASGQHIPQAILTCRKAGGEQQEFLKYSFHDVLVSSINSGGAGSSSVIPLDQFSLNFGKYEVEYREQKDDGTLSGPIKHGWDLKLNKKV